MNEIKKNINALACGKRLEYQSFSQSNNFLFKKIVNKEYLKKYLQDLRYYDDYTYSHCINVAFYGMLIGMWLHKSEEKVLDIIQAGLLHDIGKIKIPKEILKKECKLTESEYWIMKQHSVKGYEILKESSVINSNIKEAVLMHHERIDGSGYPTAAKGECISEYAKIIAVADVYDAMTSNRPYKEGVTPFKAFQMFKTVGKNEFDATIVNVFTLNILSNLVGSKVRLDNGMIGEIVNVPFSETDNLIVRIKSTFMEILDSCGPQIDCVLG